MMDFSDDLKMEKKRIKKTSPSTTNSKVVFLQKKLPNHILNLACSRHSLPWLQVLPGGCGGKKLVEIGDEVAWIPPSHMSRPQQNTCLYHQ